MPRGGIQLARKKQIIILGIDFQEERGSGVFGAGGEIGYSSDFFRTGFFGYKIPVFSSPNKMVVF